MSARPSGCRRAGRRWPSGSSTKDDPLALEPSRRNRAMLRLAYAAGLRVSELVGLRWRDVVERGDAGQVTVLGKGGKTRALLLSAATWAELVALRGAAGADGPVFRSRRGGHLDPAPAWRIV